MCGRYTLSDPGDLLTDLGVEVPGEVGFRPRYNIAPTQAVAAVRNAPHGGNRELWLLHWGLIPSWAKDHTIGNRMINARSETVAEKPSFRNAFKRRRCLILTDGFYEWVKVGKAKQPHHIHLQGGRPFVFAGLWEHWTKGQAGPIESCTILTTESNEKLRPLHHRMPVILHRKDWDLWLDPSMEDPAALLPLLKPYPDDEIEYRAVSQLVNNPRNDVPECLNPVEM
jgi:putative SOS response-associated peptidase YedK